MRRFRRPTVDLAFLAASLLALSLAGCDDATDPREEVEVIAAGEDWWLGVAEGPELRSQVEGPTSTTHTGVGQYADPPVLAEAHAFMVPAAGGRDVALVAGPTPEGTAEILLSSELGGTVEAQLFEAEGWQWYLAEIADTDASWIIEALDADGAVLDIAEVDLQELDSDAPGS